MNALGEDLYLKAVKMINDGHTIYHTAKTLRVNFSALKSRLRQNGVRSKFCPVAYQVTQREIGKDRPPRAKIKQTAKEGNLLTLAQIGPNMCKWPVKTNDKDQWLFCGDPTGFRTYCPHHHDESHKTKGGHTPVKLRKPRVAQGYEEAGRCEVVKEGIGKFRDSAGRQKLERL